MERIANAQRTEATRAALIGAARRLFAEKGYAATSTPEIVAEARVTRGALYHHYTDKSDLFMAVARQAAAEVAYEIDRRSRGETTPLGALVKGAEAYFAAMAEGGRARLLLIDAPAILRPAQVLELSDIAGAQELLDGLRAALGRRKEVPIEELAMLLSAAFDRAALAIAKGESPARYRAAIRFLLGELARES